MATRRAAAKARAATEGATPKSARAFPSNPGTPGLRADGFAFTLQRAMAVPVEYAWDAFASAARVTEWFGARHRHDFREGGAWRRTGCGHGVIKRIVDYRYIGFTWQDRRSGAVSSVDVEFRVRVEGSVTVKLTHRRIATAEEREALRSMWSGGLDSMKSFAEAWLADVESVARGRS